MQESGSRGMSSLSIIIVYHSREEMVHLSIEQYRESVILSLIAK